MHIITANITSQAMESTFSYDDTVMLQVNLENFVVDVAHKEKVTSIINATIDKQANMFLSNAINVVYPQSIDSYKTQISEGYPFNPYTALLKYQVTYNNNCNLSFYYDNYQYTGGAHGTTLRKSNTFDLKTGLPATLNTFVRTSHKNLLDQIISQATKNLAANPGIYFDDYPQLIVKNFNPNSFYLTNNGIVIYYQQYEIAPYSTGIVEFTIPYTNAPMC